jgi:signal transduction histidine kinase
MSHDTLRLRVIRGLRRVSVRGGLVLVAATLLALFFATKFYYAGLFHGLKPTWTKQLWWQAMEWYGWALFAPAIFRVCRALDHHDRKARQVFGQVAAAAIFSLLHCSLLTTGARIEAAVLSTGMSWWDLWVVVLVNHFHSNVFTYAAIAGGWHAADYYRRLRERERQASELAANLAQAQLRALKMQLHPHFLFNTLNGIAALNYEAPTAANRMIARLSELLRMTLDDDGAQEVPLRQEIQFIQAYLELEGIRLGERLTVSLEIAPDTLDVLVPNLLLQPLVENSIRHGIAPFASPGRISICARREADTLRLQVKDSGPGIIDAEGCPDKSGLGIANTRDRLNQLYGNRQSFEMNNAESGGLEVNISIPCRLAAVKEELSIPDSYEDSHAYRG